MRAIINGKRYDTDKATLIGEAGAGLGRRDFQWWDAGLYRTPRSGSYFLAGEGGPMTRWAKSTGQNSWSGGSGIQVMDADEALRWAEQYLTADEIEAGFHSVIEDA